MHSMYVLQILFFCICKISAQNRNHTGKHFVVAFFRNLDLSKMDAYLLVTGVGDANVTSTIIHHIPIRNQSSSFILPPGTVEQFSFRRQFETINIHVPVFRIKASHPVSVTAFIDGPSSTASYLAIPSDIAGNEYRMMPVCDSLRRDLCVCIIVTLEENTLVSLQNDNHGNVSVVMSVDGGNHRTDRSVPRTTKSFFLNSSIPYVSLESEDDFTGLLVYANQAIAVFCGNLRQGYTVSMEQVLPVTQFGRNFHKFHVPLLHVQKLRLIIHYNCTQIEIGLKRYTQNSGEYKDFIFNRAHKITSNKPIAVLQIFSESGGKPGEGLLVVPAIEQYFSTAVIPKRKEDQLNGSVFMFLGITHKACYYSMTGISTIQRQAISYTHFKPTDKNNPLVRFSVQQESCDNCENGFGIYVNRISSEQVSINVAGYKFFLPKKNQTSQYVGPSCGEERVVNDGTNQPTNIYTKDAYHTTVEAKLEHEPKTTNSPEIMTKNKATIWIEPSSSSSVLNCTCNANPTEEFDIQTNLKLLKKMKMMREDLLLNKRNLSSYRRRKTSADDDRLSSKGIGIIGVGVLCAFASFIFMMDFNTLTHHGSILLRKIIKIKNRF